MKVMYVKKINLCTIVTPVLIITAFILLIPICLKNNQSVMCSPVPVEISGKYSYDNGETWYELEKRTSLSAYMDKVIIRGNVSPCFENAGYVNFYLDHITANIFVNGARSFIDSRAEIDVGKSGCCRQWMTWDATGIREEDTVEIHLENPHSFGNKNAYNKFLDSMYAAHSTVFAEYLSQRGKYPKTLGLIIITVSIMVLSVITTARILKIYTGDFSGKISVFCFLTGIYMYCNNIDSGVDLAIISNNNILNTYLPAYCIMLIVPVLISGMYEIVKNKTRKVMSVVLIISSVMTFIMMALSVADSVDIYDMLFLWNICSSVLVIISVGCCIMKIKQKKSFNAICYIFLAVALLARLAGYWFDLCIYDMIFRIIVTLVFLVYISKCIRIVSVDHSKSANMDIMEFELENNRVSMMLSQIHPHFLSNTLTSIAMLCEKDIDQAQTAILNLADHFRKKIYNSKSVTDFDTELENLKNYISIEKMRFGDSLKFVYDIETTDFRIPTFILQPLVENSIKHGLKNGEGTICIRVREYAEHYEISVEDNGDGFKESDHSGADCRIGMENVKKRLDMIAHAHMEILSAENSGTVIKIILPRDDNDENSCS